MESPAYPQVTAARLTRMVEVSRVLNSKTDLRELLEYILDEAVALTGAESASILLVDHRTRELRFKAASHGMPEKLIDMPVPIKNSIAGAVLLENRPLIIEDVRKDARWHSNIDQKIDFHTESILGVPMHDVDRPVGVLEAINKLEGAFTQEDVDTLVTLADLAGVAVEKARLFQALKIANQRLNELDELKSNFISVASHELRTPLSIILGYVSYLREAADPEMAAQMDSVLRAAIQLRSLIQDMLNLRYVDVGDVTLKRDRVDFTRLLREIVRQRDTADAKRLTVMVLLPAAPVYVRGDRAMLELVINNLLNNAVKFTPAGGEIEVELKSDHDELRLRVSDSGVGIPEDKLDRIFNRFYQVESPLTRQYEGLGLGLSIARELVELHNGRIWAESGLSDLREGSQFYVALPTIP